MRALEILVHDRDKRPRADVLVEAHVGDVVQLRVTNELGIAQFAVPSTEMATIVVDGVELRYVLKHVGAVCRIAIGH
jgi:hypothetical protein